MATRVLSHIRKPSLANSLFQAGYGSPTSTISKHSPSLSTPGLWGAGCARAPLPAISSSRKEFSSITSDLSRLIPSAGFTLRSLSYSSLGSIVRLPHHQSSLGASWGTNSSRSFSTSEKFANMRLNFPKQRRNRGPMRGTVENHISFGKYGLQALQSAWITVKQINAGQLAIKRNMKGGKLFLRVFPHKPISLRPAETRMGRGKGNIAFWVARVRAGRIMFEIDGVPESVARRALSVAGSKMPIKTRFVKSLG